MKRLLLTLGVSTIFLLPVSSLQAQVTTTYNYDALGRVVEVDDQASGQTLNQTDLQYDDAGNRTSLETIAIAPIPSTNRFWLIPVSGGKMVVIPE